MLDRLPHVKSWSSLQSAAVALVPFCSQSTESYVVPAPHVVPWKNRAASPGQVKKYSVFSGAPVLPDATPQFAGTASRPVPDVVPVCVAIVGAGVIWRAAPLLAGR